MAFLCILPSRMWPSTRVNWRVPRSNSDAACEAVGHLLCMGHSSAMRSKSPRLVNSVEEWKLQATQPASGIKKIYEPRQLPVASGVCDSSQKWNDDMFFLALGHNRPHSTLLISSHSIITSCCGKILAGDHSDSCLLDPMCSVDLSNGVSGPL